MQATFSTLYRVKYTSDRVEDLRLVRILDWDNIA
jgi:hypothetical protein